MYPRKIVTRPLTIDEANSMVDSFKLDGKRLTVEDLIALGLVERVRQHRSIATGEMVDTIKTTRSTTHEGKTLPFFVIKST